MKPIVMKMMRNGLCSGKYAIRKGAAARLILSDSHIRIETAVSMNAWQVRNSSFALPAVENSVHAVIPKNAAGARARSDTAFDMIESPMLLRKYFRLKRILETGVRGFLPPHISISR